MTVGRYDIGEQLTGSTSALWTALLEFPFVFQEKESKSRPENDELICLVRLRRIEDLIHWPRRYWQQHLSSL